MSLRPATLDDEALFYDYRRRTEREGAARGWHPNEATLRSEHHRWFIGRLESAVLLLVWVRDGVTAGIARIDTNGEVAFQADIDANAPFLLAELKPYARDYGGRLKVTVDRDNRAASKALRAAGYRDESSAVRFFTYRPGS